MLFIFNFNYSFGRTSVCYLSADSLSVNAKSVETYLIASFVIFKCNHKTLERTRTQYDWLI